MAEYIDREAFKKSVEERYCKPCKAEKKDHNGCWCRACWVDDMLDEVECFQPADVAPVVHGRWEYIPQTLNTLSQFRCPFCRWFCLRKVYSRHKRNYDKIQLLPQLRGEDGRKGGYL